MAPLGVSKTLTAQFLQRNVSIKDEFRRGAGGELGKAGRRAAGVGSVGDRAEDLTSPQRHTFRVPPNPKAGFDMSQPWGEQACRRAEFGWAKNA